MPIKKRDRITPVEPTRRSKQLLENPSFQGYPILTSENQTLDSPPQSDLSNYVFAVESSGFVGETKASWSSFLSNNPDASKIWVYDVNSDPYNPPQFSWSPSSSDVPDFVQANEIIINGNDIFVVYHWTNLPRTENGVSDWIADNKIVKFTGCTIDFATSSINYTSFEVVTCTGQGSIHGTTRDNDYIWLTSRISGSGAAVVIETPLGRINTSGALNYTQFEIIDANPEWVGSDAATPSDMDVPDIWGGEWILSWGDYLYMAAPSSQPQFSSIPSLSIGRMAKPTGSETSTQVEHWLSPDQYVNPTGTWGLSVPKASTGEIFTVYEFSDESIYSQPISNNSALSKPSGAESIRDQVNTILDAKTGYDFYGLIHKTYPHWVYLDPNTNKIYYTGTQSPRLVEFDTTTNTFDAWVLEGAGTSGTVPSYSNSPVHYTTGFTDDNAYYNGHLYLGAERDPGARGIWVFRVSDGSYQKLSSFTHEPYGATHSDMQI